MIAEVAARRAELNELCRRLGARRLDLFGSAAGDDFDAGRSDLDFLYEFEPKPTARLRNPHFRENVEQTKAPLYEG